MAISILPSITTIDKELYAAATDLFPDHISKALRYIYSLNLPKAAILELEVAISAAICDAEDGAFAVGYAMGQAQAAQTVVNWN